jgi:hypothetical protein
VSMSEDEGEQVDYNAVRVRPCSYSIRSHSSWAYSNCCRKQKYDDRKLLSTVRLQAKQCTTAIASIVSNLTLRHVNLALSMLVPVNYTVIAYTHALAWHPQVRWKQCKDIVELAWGWCTVVTNGQNTTLSSSFMTSLQHSS